MRKLLTWGYVAADSADHGRELKKPPRTPEGRQIRARFPAKRPRTRGVAALERSGAQAVSRAAEPSPLSLSPLSLFCPCVAPVRTLFALFASPFAPLRLLRPTRLARPRPASPRLALRRSLRPGSHPFRSVSAPSAPFAPYAPVSPLFASQLLIPTDSVAISWETAAALGLRER